MKVKGVKRGRIIELLENIDVPDGAEVIAMNVQLARASPNFNRTYATQQ